MSIRHFFLLVLVASTLAVAWHHLNISHTAPVTDPSLPPPAQLVASIDKTPQRQQVLGYERDAFGAGWGYSRLAGLAGCDSRQATIAVQALSPTPGHDCQTDTITDLYSGAQLKPRAHGQVEVDHVFPLSAAWDMGAWAWSDATRVDFANDPLNLVATAKDLNRDKSDRLPSEWLPPARQCWYAQRVFAVGVKYHLAVSESDIATMKRVCHLSPMWLSH